MNHIAIIWNSMELFKDSIIGDIKSYSHVNNIIVLDLKDDMLDSFIDELYNYKSEDKWKSIYKINDLKIYDNRKIYILDITIVNDKKIVNRKNVLVNNISQLLKDFIRNKYDGLVTDLYHENIFHLTDDEEEYVHQKRIVLKYSKKNDN